jgi:hypothetical protein
MVELFNRRTTDGFDRGRLIREVEAMADAVAARLGPVSRRTCPPMNRRAALDAGVDVMGEVGGIDHPRPTGRLA